MSADERANLLPPLESPPGEAHPGRGAGAPGADRSLSSRPCEQGDCLAPAAIVPLPLLAELKAEIISLVLHAGFKWP